MTSFKITNDDVGIRRLQEENKKPAISGPVLPVKASTPVQKSPENVPVNIARSIRKEHETSHPHRRQTDRRKTDTHVLLETRSNHDRRIKSEKTEYSDESTEEITLHGIDEIV